MKSEMIKNSIVLQSIQKYWLKMMNILYCIILSPKY